MFWSVWPLNSVVMEETPGIILWLWWLYLKYEKREYRVSPPWTLWWASSEYEPWGLGNSLEIGVVNIVEGCPEALPAEHPHCPAAGEADYWQISVSLSENCPLLRVMPPAWGSHTCSDWSMWDRVHSPWIKLRHPWRAIGALECHMGSSETSAVELHHGLTSPFAQSCTLAFSQSSRELPKCRPHTKLSVSLFLGYLI